MRSLMHASYEEACVGTLQAQKTNSHASSATKANSEGEPKHGGRLEMSVVVEIEKKLIEIQSKTRNHWYLHLLW